VGSKVINNLTWLEGQVFPLLAKCLQCGLAGTVAAYAGRCDGVPGLLDSLLLGKRKLHFRRDCSNEGIQRPSILVLVAVAVSNCFPLVANLEPYPHHRGPLDVGEGKPPTATTDVSETYRRQHKVKRAQEERSQRMAFKWWAVAFAGLISVSKEQNG
jgi:hypothetical protein